MEVDFLPALPGFVRVSLLFSFWRGAHYHIPQQKECLIQMGGQLFVQLLAFSQCRSLRSQGLLAQVFGQGEGKRGSVHVRLSLKRKRVPFYELHECL